MILLIIWIWSIRLDLPQFTLIGATTRAGLLSAPLRDRFGVVSHMEFYTVPELEKIIIRSANVLNVDIDSDGAHELARRSRGTPRLANRLLKRVRDFAQVKYNGHINKDVADYALNLLDVDRDGLDRNDRVILTTIVDKFDGGPVGIETLAASIGEDSGTLEDVYEPYLIQNGYINRTPRGRVATKAAYDNLGRPFKQKAKPAVLCGARYTPGRISVGSFPAYTIRSRKSCSTVFGTPMYRRKNSFL